jgi:hypothetical protein
VLCLPMPETVLAARPGERGRRLGSLKRPIALYGAPEPAFPLDTRRNSVGIYQRRSERANGWLDKIGIDFLEILVLQQNPRYAVIGPRIGEGPHSARLRPTDPRRRATGTTQIAAVKRSRQAAGWRRRAARQSRRNDVLGMASTPSEIQSTPGAKPAFKSKNRAGLRSSKRLI